MKWIEVSRNARRNFCKAVWQAAASYHTNTINCASSEYNPIRTSSLATMGLCCSCFEDDTRYGGYNTRNHQTESDLPWMHVQQPQLQRRPSSNYYLAPAETSHTTTTVRVVQQSTTPSRLNSSRPAPTAPSPNINNLLIKPGVTVKIAPKSRAQQVTIVEVQYCDACGKSDHTKTTCRYRERLCFYCREEGHIISVCPKKKRQQQRKHNQRKRQHVAKRH